MRSLRRQPRSRPTHTLHGKEATQPNLLPAGSLVGSTGGARDCRPDCDIVPRAETRQHAHTQDRRRHHYQHHRKGRAVAPAGGHVPRLRPGAGQAASGNARAVRVRHSLRAHGDHVSYLRGAPAKAHHPGGHLHRSGQGLPAADGLSEATLARRLSRRRTAVRGHRLRVLHASAYRPLRLEHAVAQRALGADFSEREIRVSQARIRRLGGSDHARRQPSRQRLALQLRAGGCGRSGAARRRRLSARRHAAAHPDAGPFPLPLLRQHQLGRAARCRHRRPHAPRIAVPRARLVDDLRLGPRAGGALAPQIPGRHRRHRDVRDAGAFSTSHRRTGRAGWSEVPLQVPPVRMTPAALAVIGATIIFSSFVSGIFGMAGGMILLGVLLNYFDVATGMILFSIIQLFANGWRALHWRSYVRWPIFGFYVLGAFISFSFMWMIAFVPDKALVYLALGLMPFLIEALPPTLRPNIERRGVPFVTGLVTTVVQILSGVGACFSISSSRRASSTARPP